MSAGADEDAELARYPSRSGSEAGRMFSSDDKQDDTPGFPPMDSLPLISVGLEPFDDIARRTEARMGAVLERRRNWSQMQGGASPSVRTDSPAASGGPGFRSSARGSLVSMSLSVPVPSPDAAEVVLDAAARASLPVPISGTAAAVSTPPGASAVFSSPVLRRDGGDSGRSTRRPEALMALRDSMMFAVEKLSAAASPPPASASGADLAASGQSGSVGKKKSKKTPKPPSTPRSPAASASPRAAVFSPSSSPATTATDLAVADLKKKLAVLGSAMRKVQKENAQLRVEALQAGIAVKEAEHLRVQLRSRDSDVKTLREELKEVCAHLQHVNEAVEEQREVMEALRQQVLEAGDEKFAVTQELAATRQELLDERQSAETVIRSLQEAMSRRKPGLCAAVQTDPVVDVSVAQLRSQIAELEQQVRSAQTTLATRSSELHQREAAERKLRQFAQDLQRTALEKSRELELAQRDAQTAAHRAQMAEQEVGVLRKEAQTLRYLLDRQRREVGAAARIRDEAALVARVQAAEAWAETLHADAVRMRELVQSLGSVPPPLPLPPPPPGAGFAPRTGSPVPTAASPRPAPGGASAAAVAPAAARDRSPVERGADASASPGGRASPGARVASPPRGPRSPMGSPASDGRSAAVPAARTTATATAADEAWVVQALDDEAIGGAARDGGRDADLRL